MKDDKDRYEDEEQPTVAPGMNTHDQLEEKANSKEVKEEDYTSVTRLFLDRTPEE